MNLSMADGVSARPAPINPKVVAFVPAELPKAVPERGAARPTFRISLGDGHQHADPWCPVGPRLRKRCKRPCNGRAAEQTDDIAPSHAITSRSIAPNPT